MKISTDQHNYRTWKLNNVQENESFFMWWNETYPDEIREENDEEKSILEIMEGGREREEMGLSKEKKVVFVIYFV